MRRGESHPPSAITAGMNFRIADTFTDSLARLTGDEQKNVKTTAKCYAVHYPLPAQSSRPFASRAILEWRAASDLSNSAN